MFLPIYNLVISNCGNDGATHLFGGRMKQNEVMMKLKVACWRIWNMKNQMLTTPASVIMATG